MKRYNKYKDSGVDWIGDIPTSWECKRLGTWFTERREKVSDKDYAPLSVTKNGVVPQLDNAAKSNDGDNRKLVMEGDFVINSRSDRKGSSGLSSLNGSVSLINIVMKPRSINGNYSQYLLKSFAFIEEFYRNGHGIVADLWTTRFENMKFINIPVPPYSEQQTIATFLNDKTAKIDQTIGIKEKEIELLKERRQILIQKAVTKGLDDTVKLKDSGVEWIGEIPEHWEVRKLKYFIQNLEGGVSVNASESESATSNDFGVLKTSCVYNYYFDAKENKKVFENEKGRVSCQVKKGAIIISRMNAPELVGASGLVMGEYPNLFLPDRLWQTIYRNGVSFDPVWLSKVLINKGFRNYMVTYANGSSPSMKNISKGDYLNIAIPFLPKKEQVQIVSYLEAIEKKITKAILLKQQEIERLKEYKTVLIDNVVTGKLRVS